MADTTLPGLLGTGDHASRPAATAVGSGALYSCTDHDLIYQSDGSTWSTWAGAGASAILNNFSATTDPGTGDDDGDGYAVGSMWINTTTGDNTGIFVCLDASTGAAVWVNPSSGGSSGGGPLLYVDSITLDAAGDNFGSGMGGWSTGGSPSASATVTTEPYDDTCIDLTFPSQGDRYYKAIDSGDWIYYLTIHGISNSTPSPATALDAMMGISATNDAGTGTGFSLYGNPDGWFLWAVSSHVYSSTAGSASVAFQGALPAAASNWPIVYRLRKVSTTIYGAVSFDGGLTWRELSRTDSTTFTRINIVRLFSAGGTNPKLRVGRFNLVP